MKVDLLYFAIVVTLLQCGLLSGSNDASANSSRIEQGRRLAHDFDKGNCLACHAAPTDPEAITKANIAPPLIGMRERFADRGALRSQIWDALLVKVAGLLIRFDRLFKLRRPSKGGAFQSRLSKTIGARV